LRWCWRLTLSALLLGRCRSWAPGDSDGTSGWRWPARPRSPCSDWSLLAFACLCSSFIEQRLHRSHWSPPIRNLALAAALPASPPSGAATKARMLLWVLMLSVWMLPPSPCSAASCPRDLRGARAGRHRPGRHRLSARSCCSPRTRSTRLLPPRADGRDLNPLLQDPGMVFHPPMLYMGYVGFAVAFAFAVAALLDGRFDAAWARWAAALDARWPGCFLTLGICLGQLLGLLRARLGRLVVLGSGRKRLLHALAGRHGPDALAGGDRKARHLQGLDRAAGDPRLLR
jgi:cytochrome c-type biogenesis protein CcmF